jgi:hypothetical protein
MPYNRLCRPVMNFKPLMFLEHLKIVETRKERKVVVLARLTNNHFRSRDLLVKVMERRQRNRPGYPEKGEHPLTSSCHGQHF